MDQYIPEVAALKPPTRAAIQHHAILAMFKEQRTQLAQMDSAARDRRLAPIAEAVAWFSENEKTGSALYRDLRKALQ